MNLEALKFIQRRNTSPKLTEPAPGKAELVEIFKAACRAPDHARLKPWRFLVVDGTAREELGNIFVEAQLKKDPELSIEQSAKIAAKPLRAPMVIIVIASFTEHPKVPEVEQILSTGCAAHNILLAAEALDYAGIWRTGSMAFDKSVHNKLGLQENEMIVGFIYIGTREGQPKSLPDYDMKEYVTFWEG